MLDALPAVDPRALHALGEALGRSDESAFTAFVDTVRDWLSARVTARAREPAPARAHGARSGTRSTPPARDVEDYNLERKPLVFAVFGWLALNRRAGSPAVACRERSPSWPTSPAITSPPRSPIPTARRISGTPTRSIATDAIARFMRLDGYDVFFLTGTDEHGIKMRRPPRKEGITPQQLVDRNVPRFQAMVKRLNCSNDDFIRTTEERHHRSSQAIWERMEANGDIYLSKYAGWYSVRDEAYYDEGETRDRERRAASARTARRSSGSRRRAISSGSRPIRTSCSSSTPTCPDFVLPKERLQRGRELRARRAAGPVDLAHDLRLGRARCRATRSTSCMCGSTR